MPSVRSPHRRIVDICSMNSCLADGVEQNPINDRTASNGSHGRCNARHRQTNEQLLAALPHAQVTKSPPNPATCVSRSSWTLNAVCSGDQCMHALSFGAQFWGTTRTKSRRARTPTSNSMCLPTHCKFARAKESDSDLRAQQPLCRQFSNYKHQSW